MMKAYHDGPTGTIITYLIGLVIMIKNINFHVKYEYDWNTPNIR